MQKPQTVSDSLRIDDTLRNLKNGGKFVAHRHPVNGWRLPKKKGVDALLKQVQEPDKCKNQHLESHGRKCFARPSGI